MGAVRERVVCFGPGEALTGIVTEPAEGAEGRPAVLLLDAGILHRVGPNRMNVELARRFAASGHRVLRFDFAGIGDSPSRTDGLPLGEGVQRDIAAALHTLGAPRAVVMGLCSGADNALRAAYRDPRVVGATLLDPTVFRTPGWYARRAAEKLREDPLGALRSLAKRLQPAEAPPAGEEAPRPEMFQTGFQTREEVEAHLGPVLARGVALLYVFSGGWADIFNYPGQLRDNHPTLNLDGVRLHHHPEADHTFSQRAHREVLFDEIARWLAGVQ